MTTKKVKDYIMRLVLGKEYVPRGLFELHQYFRNYEPIEFRFTNEGESIIAESKNFRHGSIVTSGRDSKELNKNIKDAIMTSFEVPSSFSKEADIKQVRKEKKEYAFA
jgi:hypothetical protein